MQKIFQYENFFHFYDYKGIFYHLNTCVILNSWQKLSALFYCKNTPVAVFIIHKSYNSIRWKNVVIASDLRFSYIRHCLCDCTNLSISNFIWASIECTSAYCKWGALNHLHKRPSTHDELRYFLQLHNFWNQYRSNRWMEMLCNAIIYIRNTVMKLSVEKLKEYIRIKNKCCCC